MSDRGMLALLAVDGFIVGVLSVAFLNLYVGPVPAPVSAVVGAVIVTVLVRWACTVTGGPARLTPLVGWLIPVVAGLLGGPGGDAVLFSDWRTLLLVIVGIGLPVVTSWRRGPAVRTATERLDDA